MARRIAGCDRKRRITKMSEFFAAQPLLIEAASRLSNIGDTSFMRSLYV